jgi:hypothetical protein
MKCTTSLPSPVGSLRLLLAPAVTPGFNPGPMCLWLPKSINRTIEKAPEYSGAFLFYSGFLCGHSPYREVNIVLG